MFTSQPTATIQNGRDREVAISAQTMVVRDSTKGTEVAVALDDAVRMQLSQALKPTSTEAACQALYLLGNAIRHGEGAGVADARQRRNLRNHLEYLVDQITGARTDDLDQILTHIGVTRSGAFAAPALPSSATAE